MEFFAARSRRRYQKIVLLSSNEASSLQSVIFLERLRDEDVHVWRGNRLTVWSGVHKDNAKLRSELALVKYEFLKYGRPPLFDTISSTELRKTN